MIRIAVGILLDLVAFVVYEIVAKYIDRLLGRAA